MSKKENNYTIEEVARHNDENDLWIVIHNGVYNVTKFLKEHPGGEEVLIDLAGRDGTDCFEAIGHSSEALQLRELYKIGDIIDDGDISNKKSPTDVEISNNSSNNDNKNDAEEPWDYIERNDDEKTSPWMFIFLSIAALVYAIIFYFIF